MIRADFYKMESGIKDALGNSIKSEVLIASMEGTISAMQSSIINTSNQVSGTSYDVTKTVYTLTVPFQVEVLEASAVLVDGVKFALNEKIVLRRSRRIMFYCQKVK